ncbi:hypothetical protein Sjap_024659 [Stephania japonica]|uniref:Protein kinase domain-containing protein n=1 Tax=Stephania japonica TaxID=461633 RepID=A0AAP0HNX8_9MAGN
MAKLKSSALLWTAVLLWCFLLGKPDLVSDTAALLALRSSLRGKTMKWNVTDPAPASPCRWQGVQCESNRVIGLRLPGFALVGDIPPGTVGNLTRLRTLSLRFNALTGTLPSDLAQCVDLRNLYLQDNRFSGEIPDVLFRLHNLVRLNLAGNNFSGEISASFSNLTRLGTLFMENNRMSGSIPELDLPNLVQFNVSFNRLNGSIPMNLRSKSLQSFLGNSLCGGPLGLCPGESPTDNSTVPQGNRNGNGKKKLSGGAIAGIAIASVVGLLLILLVLFLTCRRKSSGKTSSVEATSAKNLAEREVQGEKSTGEGDNGSGAAGMAAATSAVSVTAAAKAEMNNAGNKRLVFFGNPPRYFDLEDLLRASAEVLGKGTFGTAYKAVLEMGTIVAVKRLKDVTIPEKEFREKIEGVGSMDHQNLVPLRAYYYSNDEKLLVYDYMAMGSLSALLHGNRGAGRTPLNWETRSGIALGAARGIEYLHSRGTNISHGNIKSSNILLTKDYDARVSDFGLAQLVGPTSTPNRIAGYRAPEVTDVRKVSQKADVYSFGVLLLELLTGKAPTHALLNEEGVDLPRWVQSVVREEWTAEVFDLELLRYQNVEEEMVQLLQLAIDCAAQYPDKRPSMSEVAQRIEDIRRSSLHDEQDPHPISIDDPSSGPSIHTSSIG